MDTRRLQHFVAKARQCELLARLARDRMTKYTYEDIAEQWRELAGQIGKLAAKPKEDPLLPIRPI